ncbi:hypothetical protein [Paraburkholderia kururiensis]|uniref:DUF304 domain-containing protein n=1 Tax=Paraburkholderia kururiensis TaxID=984307 RepID=A0ABZ0WJR7_9BURK|nr:hypothetical protein [Paraburkholderia kururiensis]WQD77571.1 hypothetical protein U0042_26575 [Paraburkholderia kururiensis]
MTQPTSSDNPSIIEPQFVAQGNRFVIPTLVILWVVIFPAIMYFLSGPFSGLDFSDIWKIFIFPTIMLVWLIFRTRARFYDDFCQIEKSVIHYQNIISLKRGWLTLLICYTRPDDARSKPRKARLSLYEMPRADQQRCLEILRTHLPATATADI